MAEDMQYSNEEESRAIDQPTLTAKEQIDIILHEYTALRHEALASITGFSNIFTFSLAIVGGVIAFIYRTASFQLIVFIPTLILILASMELNRQFGILYTSMYLSLLEERVNRLAGESLLLWDQFASVSRTLGWRLSIEHPAENRFVPILHCIVWLIVPFAIVPLFLLTSWQAVRWLWVTPQVGTQEDRVIVVIFYIFAHCFLFFLLALNVIQRGEILLLVKDKLRARIFPDEVLARLKVYCRIVGAVKRGELKEPFTAGDLEKACPGFRKATYGTFLPKHAVGNPGRNPELFERVSRGKYRLVRPYRYGLDC